MILAVSLAFAGSWELAGLYDSTALVRGQANAPVADWVWSAPAQMTQGCGEPKSPDGLGVLEAEAVSGALTPALAVVLRCEDCGAQELDTDQVFLSVASGTSRIHLDPMVEPDWLSIQVTGDGLETHKQLLRTQIAMEACLAHKTGRRWSGGSATELRQAFLLDEPAAGEQVDELFFRGQGKPVGALLRPPQDCFDPESDSAADLGGGVAAPATSLSLVPADVWGASLPRCTADERPGTRVKDPAPEMPLTLGGDRPWSRTGVPTWRGLRVEVTGTSNEDARISVTLDGAPLGAPQRALFRQEAGKFGLEDILALVPAHYPTFAVGKTRYVVLLVPNWQIVGAAHVLLGANAPADAVADGVGWALAHPEILRLQVGNAGADQLPELTSRYATVAGRLLRWGYLVGMGAGRSEIVLPTAQTPTWTQTELAQRSRQHALFLASAAVALVFLVLGLRRLSDLWARVPEERVSYWPGTAAPPSGDGPAGGEPLGDMGGDA